MHLKGPGDTEMRSTGPCAAAIANRHSRQDRQDRLQEEVPKS